MKAMTCGAIPITSRYAVLSSLAHRFDLGPQEALDYDTANDRALLEGWVWRDWLPSVLRTREFEDEELDKLRREMKVYAREQFSWNKSVDIMTKYF